MAASKPKPPAQLHLPPLPGFHLEQLCGKGWKWFSACGSVSQQSVSCGNAFSWLFTVLWYKTILYSTVRSGEELLLLK